jgi:hypothetical protein
MAKATMLAREQYLELADGTRWPIDGGLEIRSSTEYMRTEWQRLPVVDWRATDSNGHVHEYVRDAEGVPRLPSLERRYRMAACTGGCGDEDCEGMSVEEWFCRTCGEQVEPGFTVDHDVQFPVWTDTTYDLKVIMPKSGFDPVKGATYVMIDTDAAYRFGEPETKIPLPWLSVTEITGNFDGGGTTVTVALQASRRDAVKTKPVGP